MRGSRRLPRIRAARPGGSLRAHHADAMHLYPLLSSPGSGMVERSCASCGAAMTVRISGDDFSLTLVLRRGPRESLSVGGAANRRRAAVCGLWENRAVLHRLTPKNPSVSERSGPSEAL